MSTSPPALDFAGGRPAINPAGALLLLAGVLAGAAVFAEYRVLAAHRSGLELKLDAAAHRIARSPASEARSAGLLADADRVAAQLDTPWTRLLSELELASKDSAQQVAVLSVEPDSAKHRVHITAESRDLPAALTYVRRLQTSNVLRYPMLDSHEVRPDVPERPVLFALTADWTVGP